MNSSPNVMITYQSPNKDIKYLCDCCTLPYIFSIHGCIIISWKDLTKNICKQCYHACVDRWNKNFSHSWSCKINKRKIKRWEKILKKPKEEFQGKKYFKELEEKDICRETYKQYIKTLKETK